VKILFHDDEDIVAHIPTRQYYNTSGGLASPPTENKKQPEKHVKILCAIFRLYEYNILKSKLLISSHDFVLFSIIF